MRAGLRPPRDRRRRHREQARSVLEDVTIAAWKVGFLGSTEGVSAVAEILSDYPDVPLVATCRTCRGSRKTSSRLPRRLPRPRAAADRSAGRRPPDAVRFPAARLGRRSTGVAARARGRREQARHAPCARDERAAARPVPRQRAGVVARRDHRRKVRALRGQLRRRGRHPRGVARGPAGDRRRSACRGRRSVGVSRPALDAASGPA